MPCTTILVGKKASYDGSTLTARNEDSGSSGFMPKRFTVVTPDKQPAHYRSVLSHVEIELPAEAMRYTAVPNGPKEEGIWAAAGVNACNVSMTATETITSNERVLGADPLVCLLPAEKDQPERCGGIGEEDMVVVTLPYIRSAREGVERLGMLLERYGTYEMNGIAFQDVDEIWWMETIGGHHWIAKRVPDDSYVVMPNQLGIDEFDLEDALGKGRDHLCSADLREFIQDNHLDLSLEGSFNAREAFGSHSDADHCYNTPRAWYVQRYFNPHSQIWDGPEADLTPLSDDIPWARRPERKITVEDVKYVLSSHYQGTSFDPYARHDESGSRGAYRPIGINRNNFMSLVQLRPYRPEAFRSIKWLSFGSNVFNAAVPFYTEIGAAPEYLDGTTAEVTTENFYWSNRLIGALADADYGNCLPHIERYQAKIQARGHEWIAKYDRLLAQKAQDGLAVRALCEQANQEMADFLRKETDSLLGKVLFEASSRMRNAYSRADG